MENVSTKIVLSAKEPKMLHGLVKKINSGDFITIREEMYNGYPKEINIILNYIIAPKLGHNTTIYNPSLNDIEPFAFEARELLRKKLVGKKVFFKTTSQIVDEDNKIIYYGDIFYPTLKNNIVNDLIRNGLVTLKNVKSKNPTPELQNLIDLQIKAQNSKSGKWNLNPKYVSLKKNSIRDVEGYFSKNSKNRIDAIIEDIVDGSTVMLLLLPERYLIRLYISGIKCPSGSEEFSIEAKYFFEIRLLQKEVTVILEGTLPFRRTPSFFGTIYHPGGDIALELVKQGFAAFQKRSLKYLKRGVNELRAAERQAKIEKLGIWQNYQCTEHEFEKEIFGTVIEIINEEGFVLKTSHNDKPKNIDIYFSNIIPVRLGLEATKGKLTAKNQFPVSQTLTKNFYEIPWAFEAREFLRTRYIGKDVNVSVDFIQPQSNICDEKVCATVKVNGINIAEELVKEGLAFVICNPQADQISLCYHNLKKAEEIAKKTRKGFYSNSPSPKQCITDCNLSGSLNRSKDIFFNLQFSPRIDAIVENVSSGCKIRLYVQKECAFINFLLAGVMTPTFTFPHQIDFPLSDDELHRKTIQFIKSVIMHRDVKITVSSYTKNGTMIGSIFIGDINLSVELVKEGLAKVHKSAERLDYMNQLREAEKNAKNQKLNLWKNHVEVPKVSRNNISKLLLQKEKYNRKKNYIEVLVSEISPELNIYVQPVSEKTKLENLIDNLRKHVDSNPPTIGSYTPILGDVCTVKFKEDKLWYRVKVEKISGPDVHVLYIDYGNRDIVNSDECVSLPQTLKDEPPYAKVYRFALVELPKCIEYQKDSILELREEFINKTINIIEEYTHDRITYITVKDDARKEDLVKKLVEGGFLLVNKRHKKNKLFDEYMEAQEKAMKNRLQMWEYGDITEDDATEFGYRN